MLHSLAVFALVLAVPTSSEGWSPARAEAHLAFRRFTGEPSPPESGPLRDAEYGVLPAPPEGCSLQQFREPPGTAAGFSDNELRTPVRYDRQGNRVYVERRDIMFEFDYAKEIERDAEGRATRVSTSSRSPAAAPTVDTITYLDHGGWRTRSAKSGSRGFARLEEYRFDVSGLLVRYSSWEASRPDLVLEQTCERGEQGRLLRVLQKRPEETDSVPFVEVVYPAEQVRVATFFSLPHEPDRARKLLSQLLDTKGRVVDSAGFTEAGAVSLRTFYTYRAGGNLASFKEFSYDENERGLPRLESVRIVELSESGETLFEFTNSRGGNFGGGARAISYTRDRGHGWEQRQTFIVSPRETPQPDFSLVRSFEFFPESED